MIARSTEGEWRTGEFGHMIVDPGGPLCECGRFGCLEAMVGEDALRRRVANAGREISRDDLIALVLTRPPDARGNRECRQEARTGCGQHDHALESRDAHHLW